MRIGIMSMQRIINYGSYMQALGLKHTIESLGHEVEFVDYTVEPCVNVSPERPKYRRNRLKQLVKKLLKRQSNYEKAIPTRDKFNRDYSRKMLRKLGITQDMKYRTKVDTLVIGSDEVFNCLQDNPDVGFSKELFGANHNANKLISYAASFGNTTYKRLQAYGVDEEVAGLLKRFDTISVRDANSINVVESLTGKTPYNHLDPVLISDFSTIIKDNVDISDYIIVYAYSGRISDNEAELIKEFARKRGKKLIAIYGIQNFCETYIAASPEEIVSYFKHADCIITDTFHGSIFSIINERPFVTIVRETKGESYGNAEKLVDMLKRLHLENRILNNMEDLNEIMNQKIDYDLVREIRMKERERSLTYLKENL